MPLLNPTRARVACAIAAASLGALALAPAANAATADASVTGGTLQWTNPGNVTFPPVALNGSNQTVGRTQAIDVSDARGTGVGWNVTVAATPFTSGANQLSTSATTLAVAPSAACQASVTCTVATPAGTPTYPLVLTADTLPKKVFAAATNSGLGAQTITPNWQLTVPADARAGNYTATWTYSLTTGP